MKSIIEIAAANFASRPLKSIEVPEWSEDPGRPLTVWFKAPSPAVLDKVNIENKGGPMERMARLMALILTNEAGERLFSALDYKQLLNTDSTALNRIAMALLADVKIDEAEAEKN